MPPAGILAERLEHPAGQQRRRSVQLQPINRQQLGQRCVSARSIHGFRQLQWPHGAGIKTFVKSTSKYPMWLLTGRKQGASHLKPMPTISQQILLRLHHDGAGCRGRSWRNWRVDRSGRASASRKLWLASKLLDCRYNTLSVQHYPNHSQNLPAARQQLNRQKLELYQLMLHQADPARGLAVGLQAKPAQKPARQPGQSDAQDPAAELPSRGSAAPATAQQGSSQPTAATEAQPVSRQQQWRLPPEVLLQQSQPAEAQRQPQPAPAAAPPSSQPPQQPAAPPRADAHQRSTHGSFIFSSSPSGASSRFLLSPCSRPQHCDFSNSIHNACDAKAED